MLPRGEILCIRGVEVYIVMEKETYPERRNLPQTEVNVRTYTHKSTFNVLCRYDKTAVVMLRLRPKIIGESLVNDRGEQPQHLLSLPLNDLLCANPSVL